MVQWGNDKTKGVTNMSKHYFNSVEEANKFIKANHVENYHFETPDYLETGVDLVIDEFICEICGERTPSRCEGEYPNTCEDCMPHELYIEKHEIYY